MTTNNFSRGVGIGAGIAGTAAAMWLTFTLLVSFGMALAAGLVEFGRMISVGWPVMLGLTLAIMGVIFAGFSGDRDAFRTNLRTTALLLFFPVVLGLFTVMTHGGGEEVRAQAQMAQGSPPPTLNSFRDVAPRAQARLSELMVNATPWFFLAMGGISGASGCGTYFARRSKRASVDQSAETTAVN